MQIKILQFVRYTKEMLKTEKSLEDMQQEIIREIHRQSTKIKLLLAIIADSLCIGQFSKEWNAYLVERAMFSSSCGGDMLKEQFDQAIISKDYQNMELYSTAFLIDNHINKETTEEYYIKILRDFFHNSKSPTVIQFFNNIQRSKLNFWILLIPISLVVLFTIEVIFVFYYGRGASLLLERAI